MVQIVLEFEILQFHMKKYIRLICIQIPENVAFYFSSKDQYKYALVYCTLKYKSNILIKKKKNRGNLFVTISASARGICTRKCEQILCPGTFILFISTNGCLYTFFYTFLTKNSDYNLFVIN